MTQGSNDTPGFASPPCFAHEPESGNGSFSSVDITPASDVARWRKIERERLIAMRLAVPANERKTLAERVAGHLHHLIELEAGTVVSLYWPFRGELNLRGWMQQIFERGARIALPIVVSKAQPLNFREWIPDTTLVPGVWNIPVSENGEFLDPTVVISPLVGFDPQRFRLGYGGGFFDRTLTAMQVRGLQPRVVGVGHSSAAIRTIYPQPHDIPMTNIVTEQGILEGSERDQ